MSETRTRVLAAGVDPALVVRFGLAKGADLTKLVARLADAGLHVVSIEPDRQAVVAFRADDDLRAFQAAMSGYAGGPARGRASSKWDVFEFIEPSEVRRWSRVDRIGPRLQAAGEIVAFEPSHLYKLDVELWHPGTSAAAERSFAKVRSFVERGGGRVLDYYVGQTICLFRVAASGSLLDGLLELGEVAGVDQPPRVTVDRQATASLMSGPFPPPASPPVDGPRLCVLDSGVTAAHPLLGPFVGDASSVLSTNPSGADLANHGTGVAGVAVFGDLRAHVRDGQFSSSITVFSARMLDDDGYLEPDRLVITQIRMAIERYRQAPYNCRVFNLSFGETETFRAKNGGRQGLWAEVVDLLAVEYDVVIVVSAGNVNVNTTRSDEAEAIFTSKSRHLRTEKHALVDPATAAIALTVGSIAGRAEQTIRPGLAADDVSIPLVNVNDPSPFTRVGPGVGGSIKPEFVDDGGNLVWTGVGSSRQVSADPASSVLLLGNSYRPRSGWLRHDWGTSYAAPRVARLASVVEHSLRVQLGQPPTANLVRALLGAGAVPVNNLDAHCGVDATVAYTGYGRVDEDFALWSSDRRVVLFSEDKLPLDHFALFEIPVPEGFIETRGKKQVSVALAYDPPVRARRAEYLGVAADFRLFRGVDQNVLFDHFRARRDEEGPPPPVKRFHVDLTPSSDMKQGDFKWARGRSTLQVGRAVFCRSALSNSWWLVVRIRRRWAPEEYATQRFALAVVLESGFGDLYQRVQAQLRARVRGRARA